jgi:5-methylcytosine-specific restriction endonuclease McrA
MADRTCSLAGCGDPHYARGYCNRHWQSWRRHGDPLGGRTSLERHPGQKRCAECKQWLSVTEFYKSSRTRTRPQARCKACDRVRNRERYRATYGGQPRGPAWTPEYTRAYKRERSRRERQENPEKVKNRDRGYRETHREHIRDYTRRWSKAHWDRERERQYAWRRANPEAWAEVVRRYRAAKLKATVGVVTPELLAAKLAYWGNQCWMCGHEPSAVDHVKPISKGGPHALANLRPACKSCNSRKKDRWPFPVTGVPYWCDERVLPWQASSNEPPAS